jgi:hypothetical protein
MRSAKPCRGPRFSLESKNVADSWKQAPHFGGGHTDDKTARVSDYLSAFNIALKNQGFHRVYIEGCAGSGERTETWPAKPLLDGETGAAGCLSAWIGTARYEGNAIVRPVLLH